MIDQKLINYTKDKIQRFFAKFSAPAHGWPHVETVWNYAKEIAKQDKRNKKILELAALLHDIGRVPEFKNNPQGLRHQELSFILAKEWFKKDKHFFVLTEKEKEEILYAVKNHWDDMASGYKTAVWLRDADKLDLYGEHGVKRAEEFHQNDWQGIVFGVVSNLNRVGRIITAEAKKILQEKKLLSGQKELLQKYLPPKKKVLCALSGGVDSAVAAGLLIKAGFEVTGAFIKCFSESVGAKSCWIDERRDAMRVAAKLGIKLLTFDFEKQYQKDVVSYLFKEYQSGRTPNPDVMCNKYVKIPLLLKEAKKLGFDWIATGHYARVKSENKKILLCEAADKNKDQSYFLHQLGQKELRHLIFPLGSLHKNEVRIFAREWNLSVAEKEESMGICFVGEVPMKKFLEKKIKSRPGKVIMNSGEVIGKHEGLAFYTIGQRHGFSAVPNSKEESKPLYVIGKDLKKNQLLVGFEDDELLFKKEIVLKKIHWIASVPKFPLECLARLRHRQPLQTCQIVLRKGKNYIKFEQAQRAVTAGQFIVFYKKGECLGGGEII